MYCDGIRDYAFLTNGHGSVSYAILSIPWPLASQSQILN